LSKKEPLRLFCVNIGFLRYQERIYGHILAGWSQAIEALHIVDILRRMMESGLSFDLSSLKRGDGNEQG
jgi:hypothetical protein